MNLYDLIATIENQYNGTAQDENDENVVQKRTELFKPEPDKLTRARIRAFLDLIAWSEGTSTIINSDNGYNVLVGGTLFDSYLDHPRKSVYIDSYDIYSTAAGRYQILERYWDHYSKQLNLKDFGPANQDKYAMNMFREVDCVKDIEDGRTENAIVKCSSRWASFPGAGYGQREVGIKRMLEKYEYFLGENLKRWDV